MILKIISTNKIEFEGTVESVTLPGEMGLFMVLENHASLISSLVKGKIVYKIEGNESEVEIRGGIADINNNVVSVCLY